MDIIYFRFQDDIIVVCQHQIENKISLIDVVPYREIINTSDT